MCRTESEGRVVIAFKKTEEHEVTTMCRTESEGRVVIPNKRKYEGSYDSTTFVNNNVLHLLLLGSCLVLIGQSTVEKFGINPSLVIINVNKLFMIISSMDGTR